VGFAALTTTPMTETRSVGIGGLLVVGIAVLLATTFLPAVLSYLGRNIDRPRWLARPLARFHAPTGWERWARFLLHRPWRAIAGGGIAVFSESLHPTLVVHLADDDENTRAAVKKAVAGEPVQIVSSGRFRKL